jgi:hypothetical protein
MSAANVRRTVLEIENVFEDRARCEIHVRELPADSDPLIARLLELLAEHAQQRHEPPSPRSEAPPPFTGSELEFEVPERLTWPRRDR